MHAKYGEIALWPDADILEYNAMVKTRLIKNKLMKEEQVRAEKEKQDKNVGKNDATEYSVGIICPHCEQPVIFFMDIYTSEKRKDTNAGGWKLVKNNMV